MDTVLTQWNQSAGSNSKGQGKWQELESLLSSSSATEVRMKLGVQAGPLLDNVADQRCNQGIERFKKQKKGNRSNLTAFPFIQFPFVRVEWGIKIQENQLEK